MWSYSSESDDDIALSEGSAPDCVGRLLGVRFFITHHPWTPSRHRDDRLYSLYYDHTWAPGKDEQAECLYRRAQVFTDAKAAEHSSPYEECKCGLYAYYSYWRAWRVISRKDLVRIFAVVSGWGNIEEHESGFRSEHMRIEALVGPSLSTVRRTKARKMIERFAEIYNIPVVWRSWQVHRWMDDFAGGVRLENQK